MRLILSPLVHAAGQDYSAGTSDTAPPASRSATSRTGETARGASSFDMLDREKDGRLSRAEVKDAKGAAIDFERADMNHDGYLDTDEFNRVSACVIGVSSGADSGTLRTGCSARRR